METEFQCELFEPINVLTFSQANRKRKKTKQRNDKRGKKKNQINTTVTIVVEKEERFKSF